MRRSADASMARTGIGMWSTSHGELSPMSIRHWTAEVGIETLSIIGSKTCIPHQRMEVQRYQPSWVWSKTCISSIFLYFAFCMHAGLGWHATAWSVEDVHRF